MLQSSIISKESKAHETRPIIEMLLDRDSAIKNAHGITLFALGGILHYWKQENLWQKVTEYQDYWHFGDFCKTCLKKSLQQVNSLILIWDKSQKVGMRPDEIEEIGWAASKEILRVAHNRDEVENWLGEARAVNQPRLIEKVREEEARQNGQEESGTGMNGKELRSVKRSFMFTKTEAEFFDETLEIAAEFFHKDIGMNVSPSEMLLLTLTSWRELKEKL